MTDQINIKFECKNCGASPTILELPDDFSDDDVAKCKSCGFQFGPYRQIKAQAMNTAKAHVQQLALKAFKRKKG